MFCAVKSRVIEALVKHHFPREFDFTRMKECESSFARVSTCGDEMRGCVDAVDGLAVHVKQPSLKEDPCQKRCFNRKGCFALNLQAVCDGRRVFTHAKVAGPGSVNDSLAWTLCSLSDEVGSGKLGGHWFAGDAAHGNSDGLLCPHPGRELPPSKANFNCHSLVPKADERRVCLRHVGRPFWGAVGTPEVFSRGGRENSVRLHWATQRHN
eukprot:jgi/Bigna1/136279/aug1.33_g10987